MASQPESGAVADGQPGDRLPAPGREPWYNDEGTDYRITAETWPAGGGPLGMWPEHLRLAIVCSQCGRTQSHPTTTDLLDLVTEVEAHHYEKHGGPGWRHLEPEAPVAESPSPASPGGAGTLSAPAGGDEAEAGRVLRLCPTCLHDGVLEQALERARAAEAKLAEITALCQNPAAFVGRVMGAGVRVPGDRLAARILAITGSEKERG